MNIAIIGTGYVGLVTGAGFAETGNQVLCMDIVPEKIENLRKGIIPIFRAGLGGKRSSNLMWPGGRLRFTLDLKEAVWIAPK